ncbi:MAG: DUF3300 domain-containing protein [Gammaproteobacteria bacterium]|nr:DUF3300 domain-containing protein [Gammaproteobacteria bacterium]
MNNLLQSPIEGPKDRAAALTQTALAFVLLALLMFGMPVSAETVVEEIDFENADSVVSVDPIEPLSAEELGELVGPIALYPDDLIAVVLPASTYPLQIVQAARFLEARKTDESLEPPEDWDDSVVALLNYPEVLDLMNTDLDWTWKLGEAVLIQQEEVIAAVGDFRERARLAGNLKSDERQVVEVVDDGSIEITPADPEVIYVPYYEPSRVTVYHDYPVYHYYPRGYPVYYYPYPAGYAFSSGFFWGVTSAFSIGWSTNHLHLHHYGYNGHPYYGRRYYDYHNYRRPHLRLSRNYYYSYNDRYRRSSHRHHAGNYWRPRHHRYSATPRYRNRVHRRAERRHRDMKRHERRRDHRDGSRDRNRDRDRQRRQLVADDGGDRAIEQRQPRRAQLDGMKRTTRDKPRVVARGSSHRNGVAKGRATRETPRVSRGARVTRESPRVNREARRVVHRAAAPQLRKRPPRAQRPARQTARVSAPQSRPARQSRVAKHSAPRQAPPKQSRPRQQSQPRQVASVPKHSRGAKARSGRSTGSHRSRSGNRRSFRAPD